MIIEGLSLAVLTGAGFYFLYHKLPRSVRKFMQKHVLLTDAVICFATYALFGGTLTALFAAAWLGLIVSITLAIVSNPDANALLERFGERCTEWKGKFAAWAARQAKEMNKDRPQLKVVNE